MSMALAHFAFGAAMTTLVITFLVPVTLYPRTLVLAGGGWAMVPDFYLVSPVALPRLARWHRTSAWVDLFWLHRTWDRIDPTDSAVVAAGMVAFLLLATAIAEYRSYRPPAFVESVYDSYVASDSGD